MESEALDHVLKQLHKKSSCGGRWINVGTLISPEQYLCTECRAHVDLSKPIDEEPDSYIGSRSLDPNVEKRMIAIGITISVSVVILICVFAAKIVGII